MRSTWGTYAEALRVRAGLSRTEFANRIGESIARVCNLEYQRTNINEEVLRKYIDVLAVNPEEASKLRESAEFSNLRRGMQAKNVPEDQTVTMMVKFLPLLSPSGKRKVEAALAEIRRVIAEEKGEEVAYLRFNIPLKKKAPKTKRKTPSERPQLFLNRFIELCFIAQEIRTRHVSDRYRLNIDQFIQREELDDGSLCFDVVEALPSYAEGAFALIIGTGEGHRVLLEEKRFFGRLRNHPLIRHAIMHEFAHHVLHGDLLQTKSECFLPAQEISMVTEESLERVAPDGYSFERVIDTLIEEEAECLATLILVPWNEFAKGKEASELWRTYGADPGSVVRYLRYFKQPAVQDRLRTLK